MPTCAPLFTIAETGDCRYQIMAKGEPIGMAFATLHEARNAYTVATAACMVGADVALEQCSRLLREADLVAS